GLELVDDFLLVLAERVGHRPDALRDRGILRLAREGPRPVEREAEVAPAIVDAAELPRRRAVVREAHPVRRIERLGEHERARIARFLAELLERYREREEFPARIPTQIVLREELLDVLRRGAAGAGLEQEPAREQRHDRQH